MWWHRSHSSIYKGKGRYKVFCCFFDCWLSSWPITIHGWLVYPHTIKSLQLYYTMTTNLFWLTWSSQSCPFISERIKACSVTNVQLQICPHVLLLVLQIVLYREEEVLECECDMAMVHHLLSQIPQDLPYETLISRAGDLFVQFPPSELAREAASHER